MPDSAHKTLGQESFTRQAEVYAVTPTVSDPARIVRLIEAIAPAPESRVLEVACGPGFLALAFAQRCREVVGLGLSNLTDDGQPAIMNDTSVVQIYSLQWK
jgi:protein-L-isoaspartate O-methyltransferase